MPFFTTADGVRVAYREQGQSPHTVLLVHGWVTDGSAWNDVFSAMAGAPVRLVAVDLRGTGGSERPASGYGLERLTGDLLELAAHLKLERCSVAAHSASAQLALLLAAKAPQLVDSVALLCPVPPSGLPLPPDAEALFQSAGGNEKAIATIQGLSSPGTTQAIRDGLVAQGVKAAPGSVREWFGQWSKANLEAEAARVQAPVLVVATDDPFLPPAFLHEKVVAKVPFGRLVYLPGAGHSPHAELPRETAAILQAFWAGATRARQS